MNILYFLTPKSESAFVYDYNTIRQGIEKMGYHGYSALPVIDKDGKYEGTVTDGDFLWYMVGRGDFALRDEEKDCVRDLIRKSYNPPVNVNETMDDLIARIMNQNFVPVTDDRDVFIGLITRKAVIKYLTEVLSLTGQSSDDKTGTSDG